MGGWVGKAQSGKSSEWASFATRENGDIHMIGGYFGTQQRLHKKFDPVTNTWTSFADLPSYVGQSMPYVVATTGQIFACGGTNGGGIAEVGAGTWSAATNTWTQRTNMTTGRYSGITVADSTYIYIIAAAGTGILRYTIASNAWASTVGSASIPTGNTDVWTGVLYSGRIFLSTHYIDVATGTYTAYTTAATTNTAPSNWRPQMVGGLPYGTLGTYVIVSDVDQNNSSGRIVGYRDLAVSPYTFVPTFYTINGTVYDTRTVAPSVATYLYRTFYSSGPAIYASNGEHWNSGALIDKWDEYQQAFSNAYTVTSPAHNEIVTNDVPVLSMDVVDNGDKVYARWQIASDSGFTTNVRNIYYEGAPVQSGTITQKIKSIPAEELYQGTWYMRVRGESGLIYTPWSTTRTFTVSHPPSASLTFPVNGQGYIYSASNTTFQWTFSDTSETDNQTAYQLVLEVNATGAVILDTGKVTSSATSHSYTIPVGYKNTILRWKVRLYDSDNVVGSYSPYNTFSVSDAPVVTITSPAEASTVDTGSPTVTWTFTAANRTQYSYRVRFYNSIGTLVHDSGVILSAALSYTPSQSVIPVGSNSVTVDVEDNTFLTATDTNTFNAVFDQPVQPTFLVDADNYATTGYVSVTWTSGGRDSSFTEYRVYRREVGVSEWTLIYSDTNNALSNYEYKDYAAGSGKQYEYTVVQVATRVSTPVESSKTNTITVSPVSDQYWLIDNDSPDRNFLIPNVTDDSYTDEYEEQTLKVIGRGNHKDYGTRWGFTGTLSAQLRGPSARANRLQLEYLKSLRVEMYLRNPFGDVWRVATGNIGVSRIAGTGTTEMVDVTVPYEEVF